MNQLENWVRKHIREKGPISFRDFMYWSLYHPEWGYYNRTASPFGKQGDFYTSPGVHSVFGETIARDLIEKWRQLGNPDPFVIVEFGAGQGLLARDILNGVAMLDPTVNMQYHIIEISPRLRDEQHETLAGKRVTWISQLKELGAFTGVVFSNELLDAFPVHLLMAGDDGMQEVFVAVNGDQLIEEFQAVTNEEMLAYIDKYLPSLHTSSGQRFEVNLDALDWLKDVSRYLEQGFVITIDYGEQAADLYRGRPDGSLRAFKKHQVSDDFYSSIGEFDLTSDINFTALMSYGNHLKLEKVFYGTQAKYLIEAGILNNVIEQASIDPFQPSMKQNLAIKQLIMPGSMGERFKVLIQRKARAEVKIC